MSPAAGGAGAEPNGSAAGAPGSYPTQPGGAVAPGETGGGSLPIDTMAPPGSSVPGSSDVAAQPLLRSTPEAQGVSSADILELVNALDAGVREIHSLVLLRHGQVVAEGFWSPYSVDDIQVLYSGTKSFNATAIGLLADEGKLSVDDLVLSKFPELAPAQPDPNMAAMRIRDLLTMSTGHSQDTIDTLRAAPNGEWTRAFLATAVQNAPGSPFVYNSGAAYMLSAIVERVSGQGVEEYLAPRLFAPLGIQKHLWGSSPEGVNLGDGGLSVRTEDFAKFGLLYLQGGQWNGQQVLSEQWVTDATSVEVTNGNNDGNWSFGYGYQFWRSRVGYRADGSLGQYSFVLPEQDMVLAITSGTDNSQGTNNLMNLVFANIPAVQDTPLAEDAGAQQALRDKLTALALPVPTGTETSPMAAQVSGRRYATGGNSQGISGLSFDFAGADPAVPPTITFEDADGPHAIPVGIGSWLRSRTGFKKRINELFDTPEQGVAARGAWTSDDTFVARLVFTETPYTAIASFRFAGEQVMLDVSYNVRWGAMTEPQVLGTR
jgi:CubicO group peptidase (beta-lactamase class C family)